MSYAEKDGRVFLSLSRADYDMVLMAIGCATAVAVRDGMSLVPWLELVNRLNEGNPNFCPYEIAKREQAS